MSTPEISKAVEEAASAMKWAERSVSDPRYFDQDKHQKTYATADAAIVTLGQLQADHPELRALEARLVGVRGQASAIEVGKLKEQLEAHQRQVARESSNLENSRQGRQPFDPSGPGQRIESAIEQARELLNGAGDLLKTDAGKAMVAENEAWIAAGEAKIAEIILLIEVLQLVYNGSIRNDRGRMSMTPAMDGVTRALDRGAADDALAFWDAVKKLIPPYRDPRFAAIPEAKTILDRYAALEARVEAELRPMLIAAELQPLLGKARDTISRLGREIDNRDDARVRMLRKELRAQVKPMVDLYPDQAPVVELIGELDKVMARAERELGERILIEEIADAEARVKPMVERLERALARRAVSAVREHALRVRARLGELEPFLARQRAATLKERAEAALARIEADLGAAVAQEIAGAERVPTFTIDVDANLEVQTLLQETNNDLARHQEEYFKAQTASESSLDVDVGTYEHGAMNLRREVDSARRRMNEYARQAEKRAEALRKVAPSHPAIAVILEAVPALIRRGQEWQDHLDKKSSYCELIYRAREQAEQAQRSRDTGVEPGASLSYLTDAMISARRTEERCDEAAAALPEDHASADHWRALAVAVRTQAAQALTERCVAEVTRLANEGSFSEAQGYADQLKAALPDAPELERLAAVIAGAADAALSAAAEVDQRRALLVTRARATAEAARPGFDAWAAGKTKAVALGSSIVAAIEQYKGQYIVAAAEWLSNSADDEPWEIDGDWYQLEYDHATRAALEGGMQQLDDLNARMVEDVRQKYGLGELRRSIDYVAAKVVLMCEVVGTASFTPKHEVRNSDGRVILTMSGTPYPVPRIVVRGLASTMFVVVPEHPSNLDRLSTDGILGA